MKGILLGIIIIVISGCSPVYIKEVGEGKEVTYLQDR